MTPADLMPALAALGTVLTVLTGRRCRVLRLDLARHLRTTKCPNCKRRTHTEGCLRQYYRSIREQSATRPEYVGRSHIGEVA